MPSTIRDLTELTTVAPDDYVLISDTSDLTNRDKRISRLNLVGGALTGGGTVATGGFTLTVPATGTASLLGTAQTSTALKTFSSGINLGQASNLTYFDQGTWLPSITGSTGAATVSYSAQEGYWQRINNFVYFSFTVTINTISGGTGNMRIGSLPFTVGSQVQQPRCNAFVDGVAIPGTAPFGIALFASAGTTLLVPVVYQNNATIPALGISLFGTGDSVACTGFYLL